MAIHCPDFMSQILAVPSKDPVIILSVSFVNYMHITSPSCPTKFITILHVSTSHSLAVWSIEHVPKYKPSMSNFSPTISPVCPLNVAKQFPVIVSHILLVWSNDPVAILSQYGLLNVTQKIMLLCPSNVFMHSPS